MAARAATRARTDHQTAFGDDQPAATEEHSSHVTTAGGFMVTHRQCLGKVGSDVGADNIEQILDCRCLVCGDSLACT